MICMNIGAYQWYCYGIVIVTLKLPLSCAIDQFALSIVSAALPMDCAVPSDGLD